jgi:outer membrane receptor protein involved in Fe transport
MRYFLLSCLLLSPLAAQTAPAPGPAVVLPSVEVSAHQQAQLNSIDRKTYFVGQDVQGVAGSAADILQNIPSVQVDIDGNVSLRGDSNVQVLVDGRASALMRASNRGDALSQLPADSIERIEVITNPSAMYKPDGSAGIINIVLKKKRAPGAAGSVRVTVGDHQRYGASAGANYNPGPFNLGGNLNVRQDDRERIAIDRRTYVDPTTGLPAVTATVTREKFRPLFENAEVEVDANAGALGKLGEVVDYFYREQHRKADEAVVGTIGAATSTYDRLRDDPEREQQVESRTTLDHEFGRKDDTLNLEFRWEHDTELDRNTYTDVFGSPAAPSTATRTRVAFNDPNTEILAEYANALGSDRKVEAGFDRTDDAFGKNAFGTNLNPATGLWVNDPTITNNFLADERTTALYGTYRQRFGDFSVMPGLRLEEAEIHTDQFTQGIVADQKYYRAYPTLHLAYELTATQELQLNYSKRVNRPDLDDLNPFSEFQDPNNLRVGNPHLRPEQTDSVEAGDQYRNGDTTFLAALYYKHAYNSFTTVSQFINSTTLLTTEENLAHSESGGLELAATVSPWKPLSLNASSNLYYSQISASNLGYSTARSAYAWSGKLSAEYDWSKATALQLTTNYTARRLTPQGERLPTFVANIGLKHQFPNKKLTVFVAVSDLFDSLKDETRLDTPALHDDFTRRRASRTINAGFVYNFGTSKKKVKGDVLQFDN